MAKSKSLTIVAERNVASPLPPAESANYFQFTAIGGEFQLLMGAIDLLLVHQAGQKEESETSETVVVPVDISHRFLLSPLAFSQLRERVNEIFEQLGQNPEDKA